MPDLHHIYVTAHGEFTDAKWLGEKAQIGVRLVTTEAANEPQKGSVFTPSENGTVVLDSGTQAGTNGTLTRTWTARMGGIGSPDDANAVMQADLGDDMWTFLNGIKARISAKFRWTHVKIAPILADGKYGAPSAVFQFTAPLVGTGAGSMLPPEVAVACSFRAPIIGRRGRGRFYLPAFDAGVTLDASGTVGSTTRGALISSLASLVTNLEDKPGVEVWGPTLAVLSAGSSTAVRPSEIRVGSHFDAQRRRQHQVTEEYTSQAL